MKVPFPLILATVVLCILSSARAQRQKSRSSFGHCKEGFRIRREIRTLDDHEWQELVQVFRTMYRNGVFDRFAYLHTLYFPVVHDRAEFYPWHRWILFEFENIMRRINPHVSLPYWDLAKDFGRPHQSDVLSSKYLGSNGGAKDQCVRDGVAANWTMIFPTVHCLKRDYIGYANAQTTLKAWQSPEWTTHMLQAYDGFDEFREVMEHSLHSAPHQGLGGTVGDMGQPYSANDIAFYIHHANIDRIWSKWQSSDPKRAFAYNGEYFNIVTNQTYVASLSDPLTFYNDIKVRDTMDTDELCYTYEEPSYYGGSSGHLFVEPPLTKLPKGLLKKYFPKFSSGEAGIFDIDLPVPYDEWEGNDITSIRSRNIFFPPIGEEFGTKKSKCEPLPFPISHTAQTLARLGFNVPRGMVVVTRQHQFVKDLNAAGYCSPYLSSPQPRRQIAARSKTKNTYTPYSPFRPPKSPIRKGIRLLFENSLS